MFWPGIPRPVIGLNSAAVAVTSDTLAMPCGCETVMFIDGVTFCAAAPFRLSSTSAAAASANAARLCRPERAMAAALARGAALPCGCSHAFARAHPRRAAGRPPAPRGLVPRVCAAARGSACSRTAACASPPADFKAGAAPLAALPPHTLAALGAAHGVGMRGMHSARCVRCACSPVC